MTGTIDLDEYLNVINSPMTADRPLIGYDFDTRSDRGMVGGFILGTNSISADQIQSNAVTETKVADNAIGDSKVRAFNWSKGTGGTITNATISADLFTGGTINNSIIGTPLITGGTYNNGVFGTPNIVGGTHSNQVLNNPTIGTPAITGGTYNAGVFGTPQITSGTIIDKLFYATGANKAIGKGTLTAGSVDISTTAVTANSFIFLTDAASSLVNVGPLSVSTIVAGTSFTVQSTNTLDTSPFNWLIIN